VKYNCNISDAKYWGYYSPCGLLLRLRDLYKIEKGVKLWEKVPQKHVAQWIGERETLWEDIASLDFRSIEINRRKYHAFDVKEINSILSPENLLYGAGYGHLLKPIFFLAEISRKFKTGENDIFVVKREIARDLSSAPAMLQGNTIIARHETMKMLLWEKFEEMKAKRYHDALSHAFSEYGIQKQEIKTLLPETLESRITEIAEEELKSCIHHELGEAIQSKVLGKWWKDLIFSLPYSRAEVFIRSLKDLLSDTCRGGMLDYIIHQKKAGSLGFYCALLGGYRKVLFREILSAYDEFIRTRNWGLIEVARKEGYRNVMSYIEKLRMIMKSGTIIPEVIENSIINGIIPERSGNSQDSIY
jgi:hypothetical protein